MPDKTNETPPTLETAAADGTIELTLDGATWELEEAKAGDSGDAPRDIRVTFLDTATPTIHRTFFGIPLGDIRLEIDPMGGDFSRVGRGNVPLLDAHDHERVMGRVVSARAKDGVASAVVRFRENDDDAQAIKADILNGTYPKGVSAGIKPTESTKTIENADTDDEVTVLKISKWEFQELSLAPVGVFGGVGFAAKRRGGEVWSTEGELRRPYMEAGLDIGSKRGIVNDKSEKKEDVEMAEAVIDTKEAPTPAVELAVKDGAPDAAKAEGDRIAAIADWGSKNSRQAEALSAIQKGEDVVDFMTRMASQSFADKPHTKAVGAELANRSRFGLVGLAETQKPNVPKRVQQTFAPEIELADKWADGVAKAGGFMGSGEGVAIPLAAIMDDEFNLREFLDGDGLQLAVMGVADYGVHATPQRTLDWVERFAAATPVISWATRMDGLRNETERIPIVNGSMTPAATDDKSIAADSTPPLTSVTMEPHQLSVRFSYTPLVNIQTGGATDMYLRAQARRDMLSAQEQGVVAGDGTGNNVRGLGLYADLGTFAMSTNDFTYDIAADLEDALLAANVTDDGSWGFLLSADDVKSGRKERIDQGSGMFTVQRPRSMGVGGADELQQSRFYEVPNFYRAARSTYLAVASGGIPEDTAKVIFGKWTDFLIGTWATTQIIVDPYSNKPNIEVVVVMWYDTALPRPASFVRGHSS